jgi:hypothetical protein
MDGLRRCVVGVVACLMLGACARSSEAELSGDKAAATGSGCAGERCRIGEFSPPFAEPTIDYADGQVSESPQFNALKPSAEREVTTDQCRAGGPIDERCKCVYDENDRPVKCKPTAGTVALLKDGRVLYFNALEGTERVEYSIFFEAGHALQNDQTRVMTLGPTVTWTKPQPNDGGANPEGQTPEPLLPIRIDNQDPEFRNNDGALFCADVAHVAGGRVLAVGGTDYYNEPGTNMPFPFGISELEGLRNARLYDPANNQWAQTGSMQFGRWYPSVVNLPSGDVFVASGVTKLVKPVYDPADESKRRQSGRNVVDTETWGLCSGTWSNNGTLAQRTLPLFPRLHLLPNGLVLYNAAGQAFNPFGQAYDQALWNFVAAYDPASKSWQDIAFAGLPTAPPQTPDEVAQLAALAPGAGFRGSTFSVMLPLRPDDNGEYRVAEFLTAGGVTGNVLLTSPGSNEPTAHSRIDRITLDGGTIASYESRATGPLNRARWYGTGVLLPTGEVMVFSGADRDEVQFPGTGHSIRQTERFDGKAWHLMATQTQERTYHNTAMLLPDGRVLVGGHAPINTAYGYSVTLPGFSPNDGRDPSFEIYSPPYMFEPQPQIVGNVPGVLHAGQVFTVQSPQADDDTSVVLVRRTDLTHLIDGDQRSVVLRVVSRTGAALKVQMPREPAVVPPGEYMLFVVTDGIPSVSSPVSVPGPC